MTDLLNSIAQAMDAFDDELAAFGAKNAQARLPDTRDSELAGLSELLREQSKASEDSKQTVAALGERVATIDQLITDQVLALKENVRRLQLKRDHPDFARLMKTRALPPACERRQRQLEDDLHCAGLLLGQTEGFLDEANARHSRQAYRAVQEPPAQSLHHTLRIVQNQRIKKMAELEQLERRLDALDLAVATASMSLTLDKSDSQALRMSSRAAPASPVSSSKYSPVAAKNRVQSLRKALLTHRLSPRRLKCEWLVGNAGRSPCKHSSQTSDLP